MSCGINLLNDFLNGHLKVNAGCGHSDPPDRDIRQTPLLNDVSSSYFPIMFLALCAHLLQLIGHSPAATATKYSWELVVFSVSIKTSEKMELNHVSGLTTCSQISDKKLHSNHQTFVISK
jgi:hypothetical protein